MKKPNFIFIVLILGALAHFPAQAFARGASTAPGRYQDWNDIDRVSILHSFALANYKAIVVAPVTSKDAELPAASDNSYQPIISALATMTATFFSGISEQAPRNLNVSQGKSAGAGALLIRARVTAVHPGSEAARHFGGIAGKTGGAASIAMSGEIVDGKTKKVLFTFQQERRSGANSGGIFSLGNTGDNNPYSRLVNRSAKQIGNDIGSALKAF